MIFRKLLCGGFGILMSHNDQMEKNIAFHCCAKMVGWLHLHSAPHILMHQINSLERFWRYTVVPIVSDAVWGCLGVSEGESLSIWLVFWDVRTAMGSLGDIWEFNPCSMKPCWSKPTNLEQSWKQDFFPHDHFETLKYQNRRIKALQKWLGLAIFCIF